MSQLRSFKMFLRCASIALLSACGLGLAQGAPSDEAAKPVVEAAQPAAPAAPEPAAASAQPATQAVKPASTAAAAAMPRATAPSPEPATLPEVRKYCTNIAKAASDARVAWQTSKLNELEGRLRTKIKELDAKEVEVREWLDKRQAIEKKAAEKLVDIYSKMRPETAATQISALDDDMAAAVLGQLGPRQASAIFNEIVPDRAAKLAGMIAGINPAADKKL